MTTRQASTSGVTSRGPTLAEANFTVTAQQRLRTVSGSAAGTSQTQDRVYNVFTSATVATEANLVLEDVVLGSLAGAVITNLTPSIATIDAQGVMTRVADGTASVLIETPMLNRRVDVAISQAGGQTAYTFTGYAAGSLAKYASDFIDALLVGLTANNDTKCLFSATNVRNTDCWCHGLGLEVLSTQYWGGLLLTPRHVAVANHAGNWSGGVAMPFVGADNSVQTPTVHSSLRVGSTDIRIVRLSTDVVGITPCRVAPSNYAAKLPGLGLSHLGVPAICLDQEHHVTVADLYNIASEIVSYRTPTNAQRAAFFETKVFGDSGKPAFLRDADGLVALSCWTTATSGGSLSSGSGFLGGENIAAINATITSLGGGGSLSVADWSGYTSF